MHKREQNHLLEGLRRRDPASLDALTLHHGPFLRYLIAPILPDKRDQEECLADVTMRVWEKIEQYEEGRGTFKSWLAAIARNTALNRARANRTFEEIPPDLPAPESDPEEQAIRAERIQALKEAMETLTDGERTIFYRKYYFLQPTAQIASELGLTERAVEGRLYRLKQRLRKMLGGEGYD